MNFDKLDISSKAQRDQLIEEITLKGKQFELYDAIKNHDDNHGNRLAWVLCTLCDDNYEWLNQKVDDIIVWLPKVKTTGIIRSMLRAVNQCDLSKKSEGEWIDFLFQSLTNMENPIAVKVHAMELLSRYCTIYPELSNELIIILEDALPYYSAAGKVRAKRILNRLKK
ncbi:hypothetical protein [Flammeovirga pacifica]|uniref:HEAT repeat domain-containing protein n=1 Tax=Flammeovirga pacifica TaxID=915059 RepID=A0A1S1YSS9_FLAPC|nr:hypothetical protein [Flammeovirga pacifica]OHX64056.1 hypothetical protein NH26_20825 [Flammeovirga pacifica]